MPFKDAESKPLAGSAVREMDTPELQTELARLEEANFRLRFRTATETIENPAQMRILRRNIARVKTVLRERAKQA
jgi:large subunit ribosomal protein L29